MKAVLWFDIKSYGNLASCAALIVLLVAGFFSGYKFNLNLGEGIFLNSTYTTGFMLGFLSLSIVFIATIIGSKLLLKETDARFDMVVFSTSIGKNQFILGRYLSFFTLTLTCFLCIVLGFVVGQNMRTSTEMDGNFHFFHYGYPLAILGLVNCLVTCSILFLLSTFSRNKMTVVIGGLLLYILYMVMLVYSGSPFMANALPQSERAQEISALLDPFGLSSYFYQAKDFTVMERNHRLVPLIGVFLFNRAIFLTLSFLFVILGINRFSFKSRTCKEKKGRQDSAPQMETSSHSIAKSQNVVQNYKVTNVFNAIASFIKIDIGYTFKSMVFYAICLLLVFYMSMEMYASIEQGIRIPQHYASSGLMAQSINESFYSIGVFLAVYLVNDLYWRSHTSNFLLVENTGYFSFAKTLSHGLSISLTIGMFTFLMVILGITFQLSFGYLRIDTQAYLGVLVFNTFPLMLLSGFLVLLNRLLKKKYHALSVSVLFAILFATPLSKTFINLSLFRFLSGYNGVYSNFIGYGGYFGSYLYRLLFGLGILIICWMLFGLLKSRKINWGKTIVVLMASIAMLVGSNGFQRGYLPKDESTQLLKLASYEKQFRKYQHIPQPTIVDVNTQIDLFPSEQGYTINGTYILRNLNQEPVKNILLNFDENLLIEKTVFSFKDQHLLLKEHIEEIELEDPLDQGEEAQLKFSLRYQWYPANGHNPMNAIIENGSFMRISRYYPQIGYQSDYEITDIEKRTELGLGEATNLKKLETPKTNPQDFIDLDMTVSTVNGQTAIGTGDLVRQWKEGNRNVFRYKANNIPFRFAVSSAEYSMKTTSYDGIKINVLYHPLHFENVDHLIENAKLTLNYCTQNFGNYPFSSISFAEVSSFTSGFNATAYPSVIFMTEKMAFHTNIKADKSQDVINELAGHELSHLWWGNNQIAPDNREGATMLTESLAMYTEMMLYKKMHGEEAMKRQLKVHEQIYQSEKGFSKPESLYKVTRENTHISYSKGAVIMVKLAEEIGEERVNKILRNFLQGHKYPDRATTLDFLRVLKKEQSYEYEKIIGLFICNS